VTGFPASRRLTRDRVVEALDGLQAFGLCVLLVGLGTSEAAKSIGAAVAVLGFAGKLVFGYRPDRNSLPLLAALAAFYLSAVLSMALADPGFGRPPELLTLAITIVPFLLVLDSCRRPARRVLLAYAILAGACLAALVGYADHMAGPFKRLALPSIENAVAAGEYLAAAVAFGIPVVLAERRGPVAGPLFAFAVGSAAIALGMTLSRGPLAGAAAGGAAAVGLSLRRRHALVFLAAVAVSVWALSIANPGARIVKEAPLATRTAHSRVEAWRQAVDEWAERPLTGHGPGSYALLDVYFDDGVRGPEHQPNAHNILLNTGAELGVIGCGTLILFLVLTIRGMFRSLRSATWGLDRAVFAGTIAGAAAILVSGAFSVSIDAEPGILFFSLLAIGASGSLVRKETAVPPADGRGSEDR